MNNCKCRCQGFQAVYRISFVDFFFFLALALGSKLSVVRHHASAWCIYIMPACLSVFGQTIDRNRSTHILLD